MVCERLVVQRESREMVVMVYWLTSSPIFSIFVFVSAVCTLEREAASLFARCLAPSKVLKKAL